jgi:O-antigen/teichoic acid export membrane protein
MVSDASPPLGQGSGHSGRRIFWRYAGLVSTNLLVSTIGFAIALVITRLFGAGGLGQISLAQSIVSYALIAGACGTEIHAVRVTAARSAELGRMIFGVAAARAVLGVPIYVLLIIVAFAFPQVSDIRLLIALSGLSLFSSAGLLLWVPRAVHRIHEYGAANLAVQGLYFGFLIAGLLLIRNLAVIPIARLLAEILVAAGLWRWASEIPNFTPQVMSPRELLHMLRESAPLAATQLVRAVALGADLIILGALADLHAVGRYAGALKLFMFLLSLGAAYFVILLPRLAQFADSPRAMSAELGKSLKRVMIPATVGVILLFAVSEPLLRNLYGAPFASAALALDILGLAFLASLAAGHYRQVLLLRRRQTTDLHMAMISAFVSIAAKVAFVPPFGIAGAAGGMLLGEVVLLITQRHAALRELYAAGDTPQ